MPKLVGPVLIVLIIAVITVFENAQSHAPSPVSEWLLWAEVGLVWGVLVVAGMFVVFLPLGWLARRMRRP
jgi:hypothetical protein